MIKYFYIILNLLIFNLTNLTKYTQVTNALKILLLPTQADGSRLVPSSSPMAHAVWQLSILFRFFGFINLTFPCEMSELWSIRQPFLVLTLLHSQELVLWTSVTCPWLSVDLLPFLVCLDFQRRICIWHLSLLKVRPEWIY